MGYGGGSGGGGAGWRGLYDHGLHVYVKMVIGHVQNCV